MTATQFFHQLLARKPIRMGSVPQPDFSGLNVLVTGAGGSIGSELARGLVSAGAARICLLDVSESNLFWVHRDLEERVDCPSYLSAVIGSVSDPSLLEHLFAN